jgi:hypothetical protein
LTFSYYRSAKELKELKQGKSIGKTSSTTLQTETAADTKVVDTATSNHDLSKPESTSAEATPFSPLSNPTTFVSIPIPTVDATCSAVIASYTVRNALLDCLFSSYPFFIV